MTWNARRHTPTPPTTPARALDTTSRARRYAFVMHTVQRVGTADQSGTVELRIDSRSAREVSPLLSIFEQTRDDVAVER
jgi:hypothetical protein